MEIKTKYEIGQKVWCVTHYTKPVERPCNYCGCSGKIKFVGFTNAFGDSNVMELDNPMTCPVCNGKLIVEEREECFHAEPRYVAGVMASRGNYYGDRRQLNTYFVVMDEEDMSRAYAGNTADENEIFATEEEALRAIERHRVRAKENSWLCYVDEEDEVAEQRDE